MSEHVLPTIVFGHFENLVDTRGCPNSVIPQGLESCCLGPALKSGQKSDGLRRPKWTRQMGQTHCTCNVHLGATNLKQLIVQGQWGVLKKLYTKYYLLSRTIRTVVYVGPHIRFVRTTDSFIKDHLWSW